MRKNETANAAAQASGMKLFYACFVALFTTMIFAFLYHVTSAVLTIFANGYRVLYIGTFIVALGNGTLNAVVNPMVATMFLKEKQSC